MTQRPAPQRAPLMLVSSADDHAPPPSADEGARWRDYLDLGALLAAEPPELDFSLPGLLAGTLGLLVSAGGTGKSMLAFEWAISKALGRDHWRTLGENPRAGRVLVVSAEDPAPIISRRLHALIGGAPETWAAVQENLRIKAATGTGFSFGSLSKKTGRFLSSPELDTLAAEIEEWRPSLIVFDTLNRCLAGLDENDNATVGLIMSHLESMVQPVGAAALLLHHTSKAASLNGLGDKQEAARGAGALTANARFAQNLVGMDEREAKARGFTADERQRWVRLPSPKANYVPPMSERWLLRREGGVLVGADPGPPVATKNGGPVDDNAIAW